MSYYLTCACGQPVAVSAMQAGSEITCSCGNRLMVPSLGALRALEERNSTAPVASPTEPADPATSGPESSGDSSRGSFRLFRLAGTDVFVHWTWFVAAVMLIQDRPREYSSFAWNVIEYVAGFLLVLLHEFGHVFACRSVGGSANRVVLWPLGGLAYIAHFPRPGAKLWTTAAGPLVNLVLAPVLIFLTHLTSPAPDQPSTDLHQFLYALMVFNIVMLVFNLLPIYPLDGGQILYAILWWVIGRIPALAIAAVIGIAASGVLVFLAVKYGNWWLVIMAAFLGLGAFQGLMYSRLLARLKNAEFHDGPRCPTCSAAPPVGRFWRCKQCLAWFDLFHEEECPKGGSHWCYYHCFECGRPL